MFAADEAEVGASVDDVDPGEEDMRALTIWDNLATLIVSKSEIRLLSSYIKSRFYHAQVRTLEKHKCLPRSTHRHMQACWNESEPNKQCKDDASAQARRYTSPARDASPTVALTLLRNIETSS